MCITALSPTWLPLTYQNTKYTEKITIHIDAFPSTNLIFLLYYQQPHLKHAIYFSHFIFWTSTVYIFVLYSYATSTCLNRMLSFPTVLLPQWGYRIAMIPPSVDKPLETARTLDSFPLFFFFSFRNFLIINVTAESWILSKQMTKVCFSSKWKKNNNNKPNNGKFYM